MTAQNVSEQLQKIMKALRHAPTAEERSFGWSVQSKEAALKYFSGLEAALSSGQPLPELGIVRGLDHWGVTGGELLESIAKATNDVRSSPRG